MLVPGDYLVVVFTINEDCYILSQISLERFKEYLITMKRVIKNKCVLFRGEG